MILEYHARPEADDAPRRDLYLLARLGIASLAGALLAHDKIAETGKLHGLSRLQGQFDGIQDHLDQFLGILFRQADLVEDL